MGTRHFHAVDYFVFILTLVISLAIGLFFAYAGRRKQTTEEYLMGGRKMSLLPVAISMCVSVISTNTFLGAPAEMYTQGVHYELSITTLPAALILVVGFLVPLLYPLRLTSINKYLLLRYKSRAVQLVGAFLSILSQAQYVGAVMYGPATALESVSGIPEWASIIIVSLTGTVYTALGGMKAVIWTDVFQSVIMVSGLLAVIIQGCIKTGGAANVWRYNVDYGRLNVNMDFDPFARYTLWTVLFGMIPAKMMTFGLHQPSVQRFNAMENLNRARLCVALSIPGLPLFTTLATAAGMVAFAYYAHIGCDPLKAGYVENSNQIMPYFVTDILGYPGLPGLFVASLFSATLSTVSSSTNAMAAIVWQDVLEDRLADKISASRLTLLNKIMVAVFGIGCTGFSFMVLTIGGNILQISYTLFGVISGAYLGMFLLGMLFPWANWKGVIAGTLTSLAILGWAGFGQLYSRTHRERLPSTTDMCDVSDVNSTITTSFWNTTADYMTSEATAMTTQIPDSDDWLARFYSISFVLYTWLGLIICIVVGLIISACTGLEKTSSLDARLVCPCLRRFCTSSVSDVAEKKEPKQMKNDVKKDEELKVDVTVL